MITVCMYTNYMVYHKQQKFGAFNEFAYFTKLCTPKALSCLTCTFADILDKFAKLYAAKFIAMHLPNLSHAKLLSYTVSHGQIQYAHQMPHFIKNSWQCWNQGVKQFKMNSCIACICGYHKITDYRYMENG